MACSLDVHPRPEGWTGIKNWSAWERIALVTDHEALRTGLHLFAWLTPGEVKAFTLAGRQDAIAWAAG